jgi:protein-S-isoprenylcysteine O-methyltransferase Ste14
MWPQFVFVLPNCVSARHPLLANALGINEFSMVGTTRFVLTLAVMRLSQSAWQVSRFSAANWIKSWCLRGSHASVWAAWQFSSDPLGTWLRLIACRRLPSRCVPFLQSTPPSFVQRWACFCHSVCWFVRFSQEITKLWNVYLGLRTENCFLSTSACK